MEIGQRQRGADSPICSLPDGCSDPAPELEGLDLIAYRLFMLCQTQFDVAIGMGGAIKTRLNYQAVEFIARLHCVELTPALFRRIQILEGVALEPRGEEEFAPAGRDPDGWISGTVN